MFLFTKKCIFILLPACFFFSSCAGLPPHKEYNLAKTAIDTAQTHGAQEQAPKHYKKALLLYQEAQVLFQKRIYDLAQIKFIESMKQSERAENITRLKKYKRGDFSN